MNDPKESLPAAIRDRANLMREIRAWFDERDFWEVQPPCLSCECIVDLHIDPITVWSDQFGLAVDVPDRYFLQTSPEAAMKRMLAAGAPSIYSIGPAFRSGERGAEHNLEFTMLEWYQLDAGYEEGVRMLGSLAEQLLAHDGFDVLCYRNLFQDQFSFDPIEVELDILQDCILDLDRGSATADLAKSLAGDRDGLLEAIWSLAVQPSLGTERPVIVRNYPLSQAALAKIAEDDPDCAARFELFADGVELANGYHELGDPVVLQERFEKFNRERMQVGKKKLPLPERFLKAMQAGLPPCSGVAMGVDRLLMVRTGRAEIEKVLPFPIELA
ncbi:MAG: EF-P lysine aminoacylase GenX [Planctomycetaceae bacterium]|nr:EF-P lysine aminoacylase GenX [Planctomycetaceae bacterium]